MIAASGQYPGAVEVALGELRRLYTPAEASALARAIALDPDRFVLDLFQAAADAEGFNPTQTAIRIRASCEARP
jgi:hypothetical protein